MKVYFLLALFFLQANTWLGLGQNQKTKSLSSIHGLSIELWGTGTSINFQYFNIKRLKKKSAFYLVDIIAGYRYKLQGYHEVVHAYNFSTSINFGYQHNTKRSLLLGLGLGYDKGRISFSQELTNESIVTYLRLNYSRRFLSERMIIGVSLVYGYKIIDYYNGLNPSFNQRIEEFKYWLLPGFSIGYCFGKKYFQKEKVGTE